MHKYITMRKNKSDKTLPAVAQQAVAQLSELPANYGKLLESLKLRIRNSQLQTSLTVNRELVLLYWQIGKEVVERINQEGWGRKVIDRLSADLRIEFPESTGFSIRNILYMKQLAEAYPDEQIAQQLAAQIPWFHNCVILDKIPNHEHREFYIRQTIQKGWSLNVLVHQIESGFQLGQVQTQSNLDRTCPAPESITLPG